MPVFPCVSLTPKDFEIGMYVFNKAIELKNFDAYNNRGILKNRLEDCQKALDDFNPVERSCG